MMGLRGFQARVAAAALLGAGLVVASVIGDTTLAAQESSPKPAAAQKPTTQNEKNLAAGETEAKKMLLLMDKDKNGKISKQEFMSFMDAEFERLDVNKDGQLDVKELTESKVIRWRGR